ncbi:MAG: hypothetical protein GDA36_10475 [Rhodobacteraceae bacterium]|nr:hypothetical protein [Paracoccaceae bacterium]
MLNPEGAVGAQPAPAFFPSPQGSITGGLFHDPVTVATIQGGSRLAGARVGLVDEDFLVFGRATPLDVIFIARRRLRAVPDPLRLRVGTDRIVGRIVGASSSTRFAALKWLLERAVLSTASARHARSDGNPRSEDHHRLRKRQRVVASGTGTKRRGRRTA